jgi:hypothetical protein
MPRTTSATLPLLAAMALAMPGEASAGPPEGPSGKMVFVDIVRDGLREYRKEKDPGKRLAWLQELGATGDPRVALALVDAANNHNGDDLDCEAADELWWHYAGPDAVSHRGILNRNCDSPPPRMSFRAWWKANEADLRRRAARLAR